MPFLRQPITSYVGAGYTLHLNTRVEVLDGTAGVLLRIARPRRSGAVPAAIVLLDGRASAVSRSCRDVRPEAVEGGA